MEPLVQGRSDKKAMARLLDHVHDDVGVPDHPVHDPSAHLPTNDLPKKDHVIGARTRKHLRRLAPAETRLWRLCVHVSM